MENNVMNEVTNEAVKAAEDTIFGLKKADFVYCVKEGIVVGVATVVAKEATNAVFHKVSSFINDRKAKKESKKDPEVKTETIVDGDFSEVEPE